MKVTMKTAILNGDDFEFERDSYENSIGVIYKSEDNLAKTVKAKWILENQDKEVEVSVEYFDRDGRAIRELEDGTEYFLVNYLKYYSSAIWGDCTSSDKGFFSIGDIYKDKESVLAQLQQLKDLQKRRMES